MPQHKVYISYAWGGESETIAEKVEIALQAKGLEVIRDKKILPYKGSIKEFMQEIGQGNAIVTVLSDKYLKSKNCMFELLEIAEHKGFYDRVFPIVLPDAKIYDSIDRIEYLKYWDKKIKDLDSALKDLTSFAHTQGIRDDIDHYTKIRATIAGLVQILSDMNTLTPDMHEESDYEALYLAILEKVTTDGDETIELSKPNTPPSTSQANAFPKYLTAYTSIAKEDIVGREKDLEELRHRLLKNKKLSLINGMGGIGKTTLASVYLATYKDEYDHIAWLTIETSLEDAIIAELDLITNLKLQEVSPKELLSTCLNQLRNLHSSKPNLLVLDNATERLAKLYDHLPKAPHWHVLVTSRERIEPFSMMELGFLIEDEAIALFQKHNNNFSEEEVRGFVQKVEYHTLTIEILARSAKKNRWDADTIKQAITLDAKAGIATRHSGHEKIERITSYLIQIFRLSGLNEQEEYILKQFTALPNQWIAYDLLTSLLQVDQLAWKEDFPGTLEDLYEKGYLLKDMDKDSYKMHPVLVEALVLQFKTNSKDFQLLISSVKHFLSLDQTKENPISKLQYIHFGEALLKRISDSDYPDVNNFKNNLALRYKDLGRFNTSKNLLKQAIEAGITHYGINHPAIVRRRSNLAIVYQDLGQYEEAKQLLEQTLKSEIVIYGEKHPNVARTKSNLGLVYKDLGHYETAKKLLEQALASDIINFGKYHPTVAKRQSNLSLVYSSLGQYEMARCLLEQALAIISANYEEKHPYVARAQLNLATVYQNLGKYKKAKDLLEQALEADIANFGENHPNVTRTQSNLATVYQNLGNYEKAKGLLEKALETDIINYDEKHPNVSRIQSNLAIVYKELGQYESAKNLLEKALNSDITHYGENHPTIAINQSNLAMIYTDLGQYETAKSLLEKALISDITHYGENHPSIAIKQSNLAMIYKDLGQYVKAKDLLEKALASDINKYGHEHTYVAIRLSNLAYVYKDLGENEKAKELMKQAYTIYHSALGRTHPHTQMAKSFLEQLEGK